MIKILHTADNHVGCRQYGMQQREDDFYLALQRATIAAVNERADVLLIAGDLFDSSKPSARAVLEVKNCVDEAKRHGLEVLGIEGNHDLTQDSYWLRVCGIVPLDEGYENDMLGLRAIGVNYCRPDDLLTKLEMIATTCEAEGKKYPLVALHCGVAEMNCSFNPDVSQQQLVPLLKRIGCAYCALGHIHIPCEQIVDGIMFVQPGSTECKSVDEPHDKSVEVFEMEENTGKVVSAARKEMFARKIQLFDVKKDEDIDDLCNADVNALVVVYVNNKVRDGVARATEKLKWHSQLTRVIPVGDKAAEQQTYDRSKSMNLLKDAVLAFFDENSEQYRMVMDIINTGNPRLVVEKFMNDGIEQTAQ